MSQSLRSWRVFCWNGTGRDPKFTPAGGLTKESQPMMGRLPLGGSRKRHQGIVRPRKGTVTIPCSRCRTASPLQEESCELALHGDHLADQGLAHPVAGTTTATGPDGTQSPLVSSKDSLRSHSSMPRHISIIQSLARRIPSPPSTLRKAAPWKDLDLVAPRSRSTSPMSLVAFHRQMLGLRLLPSARVRMHAFPIGR